MDPTRRLIGLYSPAPQSGKSTVAGILTSLEGFEVRSFANALKRMVIDLMTSAGYTPEEIGRYISTAKEEPLDRLGGASFRYLCQTLGTEWGRSQVDNDLWVNLLVRNPAQPKRLVIDDVRFPNEFDAIRAAGGEVWKIERPGAGVRTEHASEGLLDDREFDFTVRNSGSMTDLYAVIGSRMNP